MGSIQEALDQSAKRVNEVAKNSSETSSLHHFLQLKSANCWLIAFNSVSLLFLWVIESFFLDVITILAIIKVIISTNTDCSIYIKNLPHFSTISSFFNFLHNFSIFREFFLIFRCPMTFSSRLSQFYEYIIPFYR